MPKGDNVTFFTACFISGLPLLSFPFVIPFICIPSIYDGFLLRSSGENPRQREKSSDALLSCSETIIGSMHFFNKNTELFFVNLKSPWKSGRFHTSGSPVASLVAEICVEIDFTA